MARALVAPKVLRWARESRGLSLAEAASSAISAEKIASWEAEPRVAAPTVKQLRTLAKKYKRPLGLFYLSEPPDEEELIPDFRRMPEYEASLSPALRLEQRLAQERRQEAIELASALGELPEPIRLQARIDRDPDQQATAIRKLLEVSLEQVAGVRTAREAFLIWRAALEARGVLVFQTGGMQGYKVSPKEARGFAIAERPFPVVVANGSDPETARSFSLMHEFVHVLLSRSGLCDQHERRNSTNDTDRVEVFCNRVAGAILLPQKALAAHPVVRARSERRPEWRDDELREIAQRFHVSPEVALRRLVITGRATQTYYQHWRASQTPYAASGKGFLKPVDRVFKRNGRLLARLILLAHEGGEIPRSDVFDLLGIGPRHLADIEARVFGASG